MFDKNNDLFVSAYYSEERSEHGIFDLIKLNSQNN